MRHLFVAIAVGCLAVSIPARSAEPSFKKIMIVVLENADYGDALRQADLAKFARKGALLENFHGEAHPSQPNYVALVSGSTHGVKNDDDADLQGRTVVDLLEAHHKSWKIYLEGYPARGCFTGSRTGNYVRKHNPFIDFENIRSSAARCDHLAPATELQKDASAGTLPDFSMYIPDMRNDGHDTNVDFAGRWLAHELLPRIETALNRDLLLAVTFDESESRSDDNRVYTALAGAGVTPGARTSTRYDHYSLLRTIENRFALGNLGLNDASAPPIADIWSPPDTGVRKPLRVVSYNVWGLPSPLLRHAERFRELPSAINALDADVVLIQEAFTREAEAFAHLPNFPYVAWGPRGKSFHFSSGLMILSRYPIEDTAQITYSSCGGFDCFANKGAMAARIRVPNTGDVNVFNTHLNANGHDSVRASQAADLVRFVQSYSQGRPTIVGGDFNGDGRTLFQRIKETFFLRDAVHDAYTADPRTNPFLGHDETLRSLDHIFLVDGAAPWKVVSYGLLFDGVRGKVLSDHFAVGTSLALPSG